MTTLPQPPENRGFGELLRTLADDISHLVRSELALARTEAQEKATQMITGLSNFMYDWIAAILVGVVVAAIGFFLVKKGQSDLAASNLAPNRTAANLKKDVNLVKEQVS